MSRAPTTAPDAAPPRLRHTLVILTGNPNCGKTTLFNALTGLRAKVGNYSGVTVERKEGRLQGAPPDRRITVLDLPGAYSLSPQSLDERIARDALLQRLPEVPAPDAVVVVVDASNLQRNLFYATQVIELGHPTVVALNMMDVARENGFHIDVPALQQQLGVPVLPMVASTGEGLEALRDLLKNLPESLPRPAAPPAFLRLHPLVQKEVDALEALLQQAQPGRRTARSEALLLLSDDRALEDHPPAEAGALREAVHAARRRLEYANIDWRTVVIEARHNAASRITATCVTQTHPDRETFSDRLDRVLTHPVLGPVILAVVLAVMFQSIFSLAELPMTLLEEGVGWIGNLVGQLLPPGDLRSLIVDGAIAGVGAVVVFLPQICLLFLFLGFLEDTGYMARAAFLMDRLMSKVGLHGKSFIPLLSSFACAVPGIMATRTIESPKDRLVTILVAPLMSCSARLPVYTLLIAACIPDRPVLGPLRLQGLTMMGMYALGILLAVIMAWFFKKTLLSGHTPMLILELPPYKRPLLRVVAGHMWERAKLFLRKAGTVILGANIILWFLATYPRSAGIEQRLDAREQQIVAAQQAGQLSAPEAAEQLAALERERAGERLRHSFAGRVGHAIEPILRPLGFDWRIGIGIVTSFAARELFVSTMSVVYNVAGIEETEGETGLARILQSQTHPDGSPVYTPVLGLTLMVFYVVALQCVSTLAVTRRETNSWRWAAFQWTYLAVLAWVLAWVTRHVASALLAA